jgi:hypothetical protein
MFDRLKSFFSAEREYDEAQNTASGFGWFRGLNVRGEFVGWLFKCPGGVQKATVSAPMGYRDAEGKPVTEIAVTRHTGCGFRSYPLAPGLDGLNGVQITCGQCRQQSSLVQWLKLNDYKDLEKVPSLAIAPASATAPRIIDSWDGQDDFGYQKTNPSGMF